MMFTGRLEKFKIDICQLFNQALRRKQLRILFRTVSRLGNEALGYLAMVLLPFVYGVSALRTVLLMVFCGAVCLAVYKRLKSLTSRHRPFVAQTGIHCGIDPLDRYSFPSGHTMHAVAFSVILVAFDPMLGWIF